MSVPQFKMKIFTVLLNGVPFFQDVARGFFGSCAKANLSPMGKELAIGRPIRNDVRWSVTKCVSVLSFATSQFFPGLIYSDLLKELLGFLKGHASPHLTCSVNITYFERTPNVSLHNSILIATLTAIKNNNRQPHLKCVPS